MPAPFTILVSIDRVTYRMQVELIHETKQIQHYKVTGGSRSIVLQTNGPLFKAKGLKHRKGTWKLIQGGVDPWRESAVVEIAKTIQAWIDRG